MSPPLAIIGPLIHPAVLCGQRRQDQKQQRVCSSVQSEIEKAVYQYRETAGERTSHDTATEFVVSFATREPSPKQDQNERDTQRATDQTAVGQGLQLVVVRLLQPQVTVTRLVARINHAEGSQTGSNYRIGLNHVEGDVPKM